MTELPSIIQAIGIAAVPVHDMPKGERALGRSPIAAAIVTLRQGNDGSRLVEAAQLSDARDMEFPLPWLVDQQLLPGAVRIVSREDQLALAAEAMARRFFAEPRLAALVDGEDVVEPAELLGVDELAACRRLLIPTGHLSEREVELAWSRHAPAAAEAVALRVAVARLMLWAHATAFRAGEPDAFYEALVPMREWIAADETLKVTLRDVATSRPMRRATSFAHAYRDYQARRRAGDSSVQFTEFEDGLFHT